MKTTEKLQLEHPYIWQQLFSHPFVMDLGKGDLPREKFQFYIKQDYYFLIQYSRVLALASAKSPNLVVMREFSKLLTETITVEMDLHRSFCQRFGVSLKDLDNVIPAPITLAYTDYLLRVAYEGNVTDIIATLLPCQWGYNETGMYLKKVGDNTDENPYLPWINMYSSKEFSSFVEWLKELLNSLTVGIDESTMEKLSDHFLTSTRYEYLFWEMSYTSHNWPIWSV